MKKSQLNSATDVIRQAKHLVAFTGAGISAESGIPTFRGENGLWNQYDPRILELSHFRQHAEEIWPLLKDLFYNVISGAKPNPAHYTLAEWEKQGLLKSIITQNIDNLHQRAGNRHVIEYHGNTRDAVCLSCGEKTALTEEILAGNPPVCPVCGGTLKPDFVFFGEPIPVEAATKALEESTTADVYLIIGTSGVIYPASLLPYEAKKAGAKIMEINPEPSEYTGKITDIFLQGKAGEILPALQQKL